MFRFITTLFFIMLGFFAGRLTADEFMEAKEESPASVLEQAYILALYPEEDPVQHHKNMLLAAALLKKISAPKLIVAPEVPINKIEDTKLEDVIYLPEDLG